MYTTMQYCSDFICTYRELEDDDAYRSQLLQAFCLSEYDYDSIERSLNSLVPLIRTALSPVYTCLREDKTILGHLLLSMSGKLHQELDLCLCLCSIETFDYLHSVICSVLNGGTDLEKKVNDLLNILKV